MGLFSDKKKIVVNVTVQPVFEENMIPESVKAGVIKYVMDGSVTNLSDSINEELIGCTGTKINTGFSWAKNNDYIPGIPQADVKNTIEAKQTVLNTIVANVGQTITVDYYRFGPMNSLHFAWQWLANTHGYNPNTNELVGLTASTGFPCYLADMRATYTRDSFEFITETYDTGVLEQLGPSPSSGWTPSKPYTNLNPGGIGSSAAQPAYEVSDVAEDDYVTVTYEFQDAAGNFVRRGLTVAITGISDDDYHQVRYQRADGVYGFFTYLHASGTYPLIDVAYLMEYNGLGTFYPWAYFRVQGNEVGDKQPFFEMYDHCKKWLSYIGVNFDTISAAVHEDNDVSDVEQCILQVAVKPDNQHPAVIEYLFKHFAALHENSLPQAALGATLPDKMLAFSLSASQLQHIADREFAQTLQYSGIARTRHAGVIGRKNTFTSTYGKVPSNAQVITSVTPTGTEPVTHWDVQPAYVYRWQVEDSIYEEIAVFGLKINYKVHSKKGFGAGAGSDELLIPVDREIMRTISTAKREQVVCRGLYLLVNTVVIVKTPWYASSFFKAVLMVVAVVVTILSAGTAWQTIAAAIQIGVWSTVVTIFTMVLQYIVVSVAIKLFVKTLGPKIGLITAIAALAVGGYNAMSDTKNAWAENLLSVGNGLVSASNAAYQDMLQGVQQEMADFAEWAEGKWDTLDDKREQLGLDAQWQGLTGFDFIGSVPQTVFGESPDAYYSRTVHSGNIGASSFDMIEYFCDVRLQLPEISETEELFNGNAIS